MTEAEKKTTEEPRLQPFALGDLGRGAEEYPKGSARPAVGWHPYLTSTDLLIELRLVQPTSGNLILRAITKDEGKVHTIIGAKENALDAVAYEVIAIAHDVPAEMGIAIGNHCMHLSAAADRVDQLSDDGRYFQVFHEDLSMFWDPEEMAAAMVAVQGCNTLEELRAFVAQRGRNV